MANRQLGLIAIILSWVSFVLAGIALSATSSHHWFFILLFITTGTSMAFMTYTLTRITDMS